VLKPESHFYDVIFLVDKIRISIGTAIKLGIEKGGSIEDFTTAFFMTYLDGKCSANCVFCPQARDSSSASDLLSRISWPEYRFETILRLIPTKDGFRRACIQALNYSEVVDDIVEILKKLSKKLKIPISVCIHPVSSSDLKRLKQSGATNIGIAMDACEPELFEKIKGKDRGASYRWSTHLNALDEALKIFGKRNVTTHLIIGIGETEAQAAEFIFMMYEKGITVGLFAFTPIRGTAYENKNPPSMGAYRRIQILRYLVHRKLIDRNGIEFNKQGRILFKMNANKLKETLSTGIAFQTSGCPGCNRPYYNESPRGPYYNYPHTLSKEEVIQSFEEAGL
jgi:biotin synthase